MIKGLFLVILGATAFFCLPKAAVASDSNVLINEIYPIPSTGEVEWVELYNPTDQAIPLDGWSLCDNTSYQTEGDGFVFDSSYSIGAKSYLALKKTEDFKFSLNNDADIVVLKNNNIVIDAVAYGGFEDGDKSDNAPSPSEGKSIARFPDGTTSGNNFADFRLLIPTVGYKNEKPLFSDQIQISEIVPAPANGTENEFIEIVNTGNTVVELAGWQLDDIEGGSTPYLIKNLTINPGQYLIFYNFETKIALNDSGDTARLIDPNGDLISQREYNSSQKGESFSSIDGNWLWTTTLTPDNANIFTFSTETNQKIGDSTIAEARNEEDGTRVTVTGRVTALPGKLSTQYFYIQDEASGIQIYSYKGLFPDLREGDRAMITGELSSISGERRIKIKEVADIQVIENGTVVSPAEVHIDEISEKYEGDFVRTSGVVIETSGDNFTLKQKDSDATIRVSIHKSTKIDKPKMRKGDTVEVSGIVSQYKDEYRILPFRQEGVRIMTSSELPKAGPSEIISLLSGSIIYTLCELLLRMKKRPSIWVKTLLKN